MILYLILLSSLVLSSGYPGASFQYDINSKNVSLGGATVSSKHIGFNAFSNPASLAQINKLEIGFSNFIMSLDRSILAASIERTLPTIATLDFELYDGDDEVLDGCDLPDMNIYLTSDGTLFYNSSKNITSFQLNFDVEDVTVASNPEIGLVINTSSTVSTFSLTISDISAGCGTLVELDLSGKPLSFEYKILGDASTDAGAGISVVHIGVSDIKGYDSDGNPEEMFSISETMLLLSFGKSINKNFNFGFNLKYFHNNLYFSSSSSIGFDLGFKALWLIPKRFKMFGNQVSLGLKIENLGNQYLWKTADGLYTREYCQKFPINFKLGSSLKSNKYMILFQQDIVSINPYGNYSCQYNDSNSDSRSYLFNPRLGFEYNIKKGLDFRCGLKKNSNFSNSKFMVFAGLGIDYMYKNKPLKFDYAIDLGVNSEGWSHNFTTSLYLK